MASGGDASWQLLVNYNRDRGGTGDVRFLMIISDARTYVAIRNDAIAKLLEISESLS